MAGHTITVSVLADTKKFSNAMKNLGDKTGLTKLASGVKAIGKAVAVGAAAVGVGVLALGKTATDAASSLQQSMGGVDAVFKESAGQIHSWAKSAAKDAGLSQDAYNQAATIIGTTLKNAGVPMDQLAGKTNNLVGLSADLSATFGGSVADATTAMGAALRGEFEPLRRYGVSLSVAEINARALADTGKTSVDALTKQEKAIATQALIYEQTADAQGQFSRESNTLAGQQERLKAQFENVKATIGTYLLPIMTKLTGYLSENLQPAFESLTDWVKREVVPRLQEFGEWFKRDGLPRLKAFGDFLKAEVLPRIQELGQWLTGTLVPALKDFGDWVVKNKDWLSALAITVGVMIAGIQAYIKVMAIWAATKTVFAAAKVAVLALNAAMSANPIGLIILAIAALVAGLVYFFTQTETGKKVWQAFMNFLTGVWDGIKNGFQAAAEWVQKSWDKVYAFFKNMPTNIKAFFSASAEWLKNAGYNILVGLGTGLINGWNNVSGWVSGMWGRITGTFSGAGSWLRDAGSNLINGLWNGISSKVDWVVSKVKGLGTSVINAAKSIFGIKSPSRVFRGLGEFITEGLAIGLDDLSGVKAATAQLSATVTDGFDPTLKLNANVNGRANAGSGNTYQITVQTLVPTAETGRVITQAIADYERINGGRR